MSSHQASEQMIGYLYQVRYALALLLKKDKPEQQISIEKFDDVAFVNDGQPVQLIQVKHHIKKQGNLSDNSTDLWRTLRVWIDLVSTAPDIIERTDFFIITTSKAPKESAASFLRDNHERNGEKAYQKIKTACTTSENKEQEKFHKAFLSVDEELLKKLISRIFVIDCAEHITDVPKTIQKAVRYSCMPIHEEIISERLEGWWFKKIVDALCSDTPVFVTQGQVREKIVSISQEYGKENLPIDIFDGAALDEETWSPSERVFHEQLKLICLSGKHTRVALRDYYRAFAQRASWIRNDLLYVNELEEYEQRLIDEWEHAFARMQDDLEALDGVTEEEKAKEGRDLFAAIEDKDIRIRPKCQESFVMRGSYHMLSNQLKVGWHLDFFDRLKQLLDI